MTAASARSSGYLIHPCDLTSEMLRYLDDYLRAFSTIDISSRTISKGPCTSQSLLHLGDHTLSSPANVSSHRLAASETLRIFWRTELHPQRCCHQHSHHLKGHTLYTLATLLPCYHASEMLGYIDRYSRVLNTVTIGSGTISRDARQQDTIKSGRAYAIISGSHTTWQATCQGNAWIHQQTQPQSRRCCQQLSRHLKDPCANKMMLHLSEHTLLPSALAPSYRQLPSLFNLAPGTASWSIPKLSLPWFSFILVQKCFRVKLGCAGVVCAGKWQILYHLPRAADRYMDAQTSSQAQCSFRH